MKTIEQVKEFIILKRRNFSKNKKSNIPSLNDFLKGKISFGKEILAFIESEEK
jgi:hypothetical protein